MSLTAEALDSQEIVESWAANRHLTPDQRQALVAEHNETIRRMGEITSFDIAPSHFCEEADLPQGSTWAEVIASILEEQTGEHQLADLKAEMVKFGHLPDEDDEDEEA